MLGAASVSVILPLSHVISARAEDDGQEAHESHDCEAHDDGDAENEPGAGDDDSAGLTGANGAVFDPSGDTCAATKAGCAKKKK